MSRLISLGFAVGVVGVSFGVGCRTAGVSPLLACAASVFVFAGGAQFAALGVIATGGGALAALGSGLALNARYLGMSAALPQLWRGSFARRALAAHLLIDESAALALAEGDDQRARRTYWWSGAVLFAAWNAGTALGALSAAVVADPAALGLDAAMPASLLALLAPQLSNRGRWAIAIVAAAVALGGALALPPGTEVLVAGAAVLAVRGAS